MAKVLISMPDDLLDRIDREARARGSNRSRFVQEAATLAERHGLTLYDAAYAAVARARGAELATLDQALLRSGLGRRPSAILSDLAPPE